MELIKTTEAGALDAMQIIDMAKNHLKEQGIDQWQTGYPDLECIKNDTKKGIGYFVKDNDDVLAYLCIDFEEEPAYGTLNGKWASDEKYVVVHRMAISDEHRGKNVSDKIFGLVEDLAKSQGVNYFRVDTDEANKKMQHILKKNGFEHRGVIWFDNSEKIAFDKKLV